MDCGSSGGGISLFSSSIMSGFKRPCPDNSDDTSDSDSECAISRQDLVNGVGSNNGSLYVDGPKPGKKTKGRVKIKMEFIENKLRRYTTFSKRKTGIMKKAYELSTLTGTQVMLLVASETGHVYTFATRKLQPMITSESGKALIQTCLNSPDSPLDVGKSSSDQRMNPTGYEETELSYAVSEDESCQPPTSSPFKVEAVKHSAPNSLVSSHAPVAVSVESTSSAASHHQLLYQLGQDMAVSNRTSTSASSTDIRLKQEPGSVAHTSFPKDVHGQTQVKDAIVSRATSISVPHSTSASLGHGTSMALASVSMNKGQSVHLSARPQPQSVASPQSPKLQQTFYKIPGTNQIISLALTAPSSQSAVLYQTYAATSSSASSVPESYLLNLPQATTLSTTLEASNGTGQQFITIPVPVSLSNNSQMLHPLLAQSASVKSEMLPTDLRYNSQGKHAK